MRRTILAAAFAVVLIGMPVTAFAIGHSDLYVNGSFGSDSSTCQNANNACLTIQAAIDRIPIVMDQDVTVHVAAGTYAESLLLVDRLAPKGNTIRLVGDVNGVRLTGMKEQAIGIQITHSPSVVLENFQVTGFTEAGILLLHSDATIVNSQILWNLSHGVVCEFGNLVFGPGNPMRGVSLLNNAGTALYATACHVRFLGPAVVTGNRVGLLATHAGQIDLSGRMDVLVGNNPPQPPETGFGTTGSGGSGSGGNSVVPRRYPVPLLAETEALCQLVADCHGMVMGYERAQIGGACVCATLDYGVCRPASED